LITLAAKFQKKKTETEGEEKHQFDDDGIATRMAGGSRKGAKQRLHASLNPSSEETSLSQEPSIS